MILHIIQAVIAVLGVIQGTCLTRAWVKGREAISKGTKAMFYGMGLVLNFFDYLGIGATAPSMAIYRLTKTVKDEHIVGTLITGCVVPVAVEALASLQVIEVEIPTLLTAYILGSIGSFVGGKVAEKLNQHAVRLIMGFALLVAGLLMILSLLSLLPIGGDEIGLHGVKLVILGIGTFILGFMQANGVGCYAPTMCLVYMLGMSPLVSYPIMMGMGFLAVAFGSFPYFESGKFNKQASFAFALAGIPGVLAAIFVITSLPLTVLRWIVAVVVLYTSASLLKQAFSEGRNKAKETLVNGDESLA